MKHYVVLIVSLLYGFAAFGQTINYPDTSVLASGSWYVINVPQSGIYRLSYSDFISMGVPDSVINFDNLTIWGQGGQMISPVNALCSASDLIENAIYVNNQGNPYALFYAEGTTKWIYNDLTKLYSFEIHPYSDFATYFVCFEPSKGIKRRISITTALTGNSDYTVTSVRDIYLYNRDLVNPAGVGNTFYGEMLSHTAKELKVPVNLQGFVPNQPAKIQVKTGSTLENGSKLFIHKFNSDTIGSHYVNGSEGFNTNDFVGQTPPITAAIDTISIIYNTSSIRDKGYLDFILLNYDRLLRFNTISSSSLAFNATIALGENKLADYIIGNARQAVRVWNVTTPYNVQELPVTQVDTSVTIKLNTQTFQKIIAFSGSNFPTPTLKGKVENQNLHGLEQTDFIIITAPEFKTQADSLAQLHRICDSINVAVVTTQQVYNEFSSGTKDYLAFKEFLRMMYKKYHSGNQPKNVLFFGDGTYDNRNILKYNNNFVPTYQDANNFCADIYVAFLDDNADGKANQDIMRIGVGRFPVNDAYEANIAVDKARRYLLKEDLREVNIINDWKNYISLTCDDDDNPSDKVFITTAETAYYALQSVFPVINAHKFYSDAFKQFSTSSGNRYPDATKAINNRMNKGSLMLNYVGHGSADHLSEERLITISDITSWTNYNQPTLFITSTCEFTKLDMVDKASGGEIAFLSPKGAAIALVSSTRKIGSDPAVNRDFHINFIEKQSDGRPLTFGEAFVKSHYQHKNNNFIFVGDPALRLNIPMFNVHTTTINGINVEDTTTAIKDTVRALSQMSVSGNIRDNAGNVMTDFNGKILITLFDKVKTYYGLDNEGHGSLKEFKQQKNVLYKGTVNVINGEFTHTFTIPKDISYNYGQGKLSYYAKTDSIDAAGYSDWFIVGGIDSSVNITETHPDIKLYMNDTNFRSRGLTDQNPELFAIVEDSIAINTVGSGLGHDIMARLDNAANTFILNDYYEQDFDNPNKGYIRFPFYDLLDGEHTLTLKVWNIFNFSAEKTIIFYVNNGKEPLYTNLINYPNPFETSSTIVIEHNQPDKITEAYIHIFDMSGRVIRKINVTPYISAYTIGPVTWDGTDDGGKRLGNGIYIYKAVMETSQGTVHSAGKKMVIFNRGRQ